MKRKRRKRKRKMKRDEEKERDGEKEREMKRDGGREMKKVPGLAQTPPKTSWGPASWPSPPPARTKLGCALRAHFSPWSLPGVRGRAEQAGRTQRSELGRREGGKRVARRPRKKSDLGSTPLQIPPSRPPAPQLLPRLLPLPLPQPPRLPAPRAVPAPGCVQAPPAPLSPLDPPDGEEAPGWTWGVPPG